MNPIDVSIIIVSYNDLDYIQKCIRSIYDQNCNLNLEIIVIDNHPSKIVFNYIKKNHPEIINKFSPINLGYANGNNLAIKLAKGEFIFIINPDVILHSDCVQNLYSFCKIKKNSLCMPKILLPGGKKINTIGNKLNFLGISWCGNLFEEFKEEDFSYCPASKILFPSGAALFLRKKDFIDLGGFNELFFMYLEDTELALKAFVRNYNCYLINNATVIHFYKYSKNSLKFYHYEKNRIIILLEFFSFKTLLLMVVPILFLEMGLLYYFINTKQLSFKLNSYRFIVRNFNKIYRFRKEIMKNRNLSDKELFQILESEIIYQELNFPLVTKVLNPLLKIFFKLAVSGI